MKVIGDWIAKCILKYHKTYTAVFGIVLLAITGTLLYFFFIDAFMELVRSGSGNFVTTSTMTETGWRTGTRGPLEGFFFATVVTAAMGFAYSMFSAWMYFAISRMAEIRLMRKYGFYREDMPRHFGSTGAVWRYLMEQVYRNMGVRTGRNARELKNMRKRSTKAGPAHLSRSSILVDPLPLFVQ